MGDDYIPGNKCGLSTAGMKMLSGMTVACVLDDVSGSATTPNNVFMCASVDNLYSLPLCVDKCIIADTIYCMLKIPLIILWPHVLTA